MDTRLTGLNQWVRQQMLSDQVQAMAVSSLEPVSGDASFRRYFRCKVVFADADSLSLIAVDAPPDKENNPSFVRIAENFKRHGVNVPDVYAADFAQGFMLLSDFGNTLLLSQLNENNVGQYYERALSDLAVLQQCTFEPTLPLYDESLLMAEMQLFADWLLQRHLQLPLSAAEHAVMANAFEYLKDQALSQPQVTVHRDYHARNLMLLPNGELGNIDFQDAVHGPITYDLVSLVRDCYVRWPAEQVTAWALGFKEKLLVCGFMRPVSDEQFLHWFNAMGAQRHLKAAGIFARLYHRDGKPGYLPDIPRTVNYICEEVAGITALSDFSTLLSDKIVPALCEKDAQAKPFFKDVL
ncbi:MAG: aminoglycoside phosphotransferase [Gammaproteobacteria bacterium]|nr:MAG: aminoglycoside phosphotransferase [Gammaproteobacteria bacterium]